MCAGQRKERGRSGIGNPFESSPSINSSFESFNPFKCDEPISNPNNKINAFRTKSWTHLPGSQRRPTEKIQSLFVKNEQHTSGRMARNHCQRRKPVQVCDNGNCRRETSFHQIWNTNQKTPPCLTPFVFMRRRVHFQK